MNPKDPQFPDASKYEDRPEGWDYLTPESMDEMSQHFSKKEKPSK